MKCKYCGRESHRSYCDQGCRDSATAFMRFREENARTFLIGVLAPFLLLIPGFLFIDHYCIFIFMSMLISGITCIRFPFSSDETIEMMGVRRSISFTRKCGIGLIAIGCVFLAFQFAFW